MNTVYIAGNIGKEPKFSITKNGNPVLEFSIATKEYDGKDTNGTSKYTTQWHNIIAYGQTANRATQHLHRGSNCMVLGKIQYKTFTRKDKTTGYITQVLASQLFYEQIVKNPELEKLISGVEDSFTIGDY